MKKYLWLSVFLLLFHTLYGADRIIQKAVLSLLPESPYAGMERTIRNSLLSEASGLTNIYILSADREELDMLGVKDVNATLMLRVEKNGTQMTLTIYKAVSTDKVPLEGPITWPAGRLPENLSRITSNALDIITRAYPPIDKKDLKIEPLVISKSEYERENPTWSVRFLPFQLEAVLFDMSYQVSNTNGGSLPNKFSYEKAGFGRMSMELALDWKAFHGRLEVSANPLEFTGVTTKLEAGYGLWGSFIILGAGLTYGWRHFDLTGSFANIYDLPAYGVTNRVLIPMPDIQMHIVTLNPMIRFNISTRLSFDILVHLDVYRQSSFQYPTPVNNHYATEPGFMLNMTGGSILFHMQLAPRHTMVLFYELNARYEIFPSTAFGILMADLGAFTLAQNAIDFIDTVIGLGYQYEF